MTITSRLRVDFSIKTSYKINYGIYRIIKDMFW